MVNCQICGIQNADAATHCSHCGYPFYGTTVQGRHQYKKYNGEYSPRKESGIGLLIAGIIIISIGLMLYFNQIGLLFEYFWPIVLVIIGVWLLIRGLKWSQRGR